PWVAPRARVAVGAAQEVGPVCHRLAPPRFAAMPPRQGEVDDEAGARHQMARRPVVDRAVVAKEMVEAAARVDATRVVERQRAADMPLEERAVAKVGQSHPARTSATSSGVGAWAPVCRQAAAAVAAAKAR